MSFTFSQEEIAKIAHLARLEFEKNGPQSSIQDDLNKIVRMVGQISSATTNGIEPMAHPLEMPQPLRADEVTEKNEREKLQTLSSWKEAGLFLVPTVIE